MDDTWALATMLADPMLDVRLVVLSTNNTLARAKIVAKLLSTSSAAVRNTTLLVGRHENSYAGPQAAWAADFDLATHPGAVLRDVDSAQVVADTIRAALTSSEDAHVILVELAPPVVFGEVAARWGKQLFGSGRVAVSQMGGSFYYGYGHQSGCAREYNVAHNATASQLLMGTPELGARSFALSPLDTSSLVRIEGDLWQQLLLAVGSGRERPLLERVLDSYRAWKRNCPSDPFGLM